MQGACRARDCDETRSRAAPRATIRPPVRIFCGSSIVLRA
jgi:hypothetical protein